MRNAFIVFWLTIFFFAFTKNDIDKHIYLGRGILLHRTGYILSFNTNTMILNAAYYFATKEHLENIVTKRYSKFLPDPDLPKRFQVYSSAYKDSGFDRGHNVNAQDMKWDEQAEKETFYLSNIVPQYPTFNRGLWERLEDYVRELTMKYRYLVVITGDITTKKSQKMQGTDVAIPDFMYKVIVFSNTNTLCFICPNQEYEKGNKDFQRFEINLNDLEKQTGIDYFKNFDSYFISKLNSNNR